MKPETASEENERHNANVVKAKALMWAWEQVHPNEDEESLAWQLELARVSLLVTGWEPEPWQIEMAKQLPGKSP